MRFLLFPIGSASQDSFRALSLQLACDVSPQILDAESLKTTHPTMENAMAHGPDFRAGGDRRFGPQTPPAAIQPVEPISAATP